MWTGITMFIIWCVGYVVISCIYGYKTNDWNIEYADNPWNLEMDAIVVIILIWPIIAIVLGCYLVLIAPIRLGSKLRAKHPPTQEKERDYISISL